MKETLERFNVTRNDRVENVWLTGRDNIPFVRKKQEKVMRTPTGMVRNRFTAFAAQLRFPKLVALTVSVFVIDMLVPDMVPFADEILLGLLASILATFKKK